MKSTWISLSVVAAAAAVLAMLALGTSNPAQAMNKMAPTTTSAPASAPATAAVVNARCPMTGEKIDSAKVPLNLVTTYKDQKVGFCCDGCPQAFAKLSDADKDKKLAAAMKPADAK
jgi:hypothetical protein